MSPLISLGLAAVLGYLLGSISTGVLYSRALGGDVRTAGSRNAGASNMLRIYGMRPGIITFAGDFLKAVLSVLLGYLICGRNGAMAGGLCAVIGHNWPLFFGFRGGKGVACCTAVFALTFPQYGIPAVLFCVAVIALTRFISLGSLSMSLCFAVLTCIFQPVWPVGVWSALLLIMCVWRHRTNIARLLQGTERRIGEKENRG